MGYVTADFLSSIKHRKCRLPYVCFVLQFPNQRLYTDDSRFIQAELKISPVVGYRTIQVGAKYHGVFYYFQTAMKTLDFIRPFLHSG